LPSLRIAFSIWSWSHALIMDIVYSCVMWCDESLGLHARQCQVTHK
jgi:hypothetical protein